QGELRLMDFGQAVLLRGADGNGTELRYFRLCGKDYYRAPECYMPSVESCPNLVVQAQCPPGCTPGHVVQVAGGGYLCNVRFPATAVPGEASVAEIFGYAVAPVDVFASGVAFFILLAQAPPWHQALVASRGFAYVYQYGVQALLTNWKKPLSPEGMELLTGMLHSYPTARWTLKRCL
ncbi:unnamed protein product, partial [Polarella glacialis]